MKDRGEAYELLRSLGASQRLIVHAELVAGVSDKLLTEFKAIGIPCDIRTIELGAVLHDAGKIHYPQELAQPGSLHEKAGEALLLANGVEPAIAHCCATHRAWNLPGVTFEERTVALADKLWKGKREADLELSIIDEGADRLSVSRWDVFDRLDSTFEDIASEGSDRLQKSRTSSS